MKITGNIVGFVILIFLVSACSTEEDLNNQPVGETSITAQISEELWEAVEYESALNVIPGKGQFFELSAFNENYELELSVLEFDKATGTISEGIYDKEDNFFLSLFLKISEEDEIEYRPMQAEDDEESPMNITITASSNSRISGSFSGVVHKVSQEEGDNYPEILLITNGVFNNLPFETNTVNIQ